MSAFRDVGLDRGCTAAQLLDLADGRFGLGAALVVVDGDVGAVSRELGEMARPTRTAGDEAICRCPRAWESGWSV